MILSIIELILALTIPILIIKLKDTWLCKKIGVIGCNYLLGIIYALMFYVLLKTNLLTERDTSLLEIVSYLSISFSIPFLLFQTNFKELLKLSKKSILSFFLLILSVFTVTAITYIVFSKNIENGKILSGMAIGLYTGGTPNLNAVAYFFGLDNTTIAMSNICDIIFGGIFYIFLLFLAKPLSKAFLKYAVKEEYTSIDENTENNVSEKKGIITNSILCLAIVLVSALIGYLLFIITGSREGTLVNFLVPSLMLGSTILGLVFSFNKKVRNVKHNNSIGNYFACVFSFSISMIINFTQLSGLTFSIFIHFAVITVSTFIIHLLLCKIFKVGADIMITSCTAGIYGPAFIPSVTHSIGADYMLPTGLLLGSFGYAVGTFLGIGFVELLMLL